MVGQASAIPVGTQFSPTLIDLSAFLNAIIEFSGDKALMSAAVWRAPVRKKPVQKPPTARRASLPLEAARQYDLLDSRYEATDLARELAALPDHALHDAFARHILLHLGGLRVVEAAQQMAYDGQKITGDSLAGYLTDQGFPVAVHNTAINSLRMWLAEACLLPRERSRRLWEVDVPYRLAAPVIPVNEVRVATRGPPFKGDPRRFVARRSSEVR